MAKLLKLRRGTTSQHSSFTGAEGEVTVDTTKDTIVVHDGSTAGGTALAKESAVTAIPAVIDEDNMSSNSATRPPSQQSVKAYVDALPDVIDEDNFASNSATRPASQQSVKAYVDALPDVIDEDNMSSNSATRPPSQQSTKAYVDAADATKAPLASPALTGTATGVNLTLSGNLTVNGTTTTVATTNTTLTDNLLELNSGASSNANDAGILIERGSTGDNAIIAWDESADKFTVGTTTGTASSTGNISITTGTLVANVEGNVTGDVTGDVTGNVSGTAATVTGAAQSAITSVGTLTGLTVSGAVSTGDLTVLDPTPDLKLQDSNHTGSSTEHTIYFKDSTGANQMNIGSPTGEQHLRIKHDTTELIKIQTDGKVGIGTTSPSFVADIKGATDNLIRVGNSNETGHGSHYTAIVHGATYYSKAYLAADLFEWYVNGASLAKKMTLEADGDLVLHSGTVSDSKGDLRKIIQNTQGSSYTLVAADAGKHILASGTITIPNSTFAAGDAVSIVNNTSSDLTLTSQLSTTRNSGDEGNAPTKLTKYGMCTFLFVSSTVAYVSGAGLE